MNLEEFGGYILEGHTPVKCSDIQKWGEFMSSGNRRVAESNIGDVRVSTVFLGLDHDFGWSEGGPPILFETMIFGGEHDQFQDRCSTWEQAEEMHKAALAKVTQ